MSGDLVVRKLRRWKQADAGWFRDMDNVCFPEDTSFHNDDDYHWWVAYRSDGVPVAYAGMRVQAWRDDPTPGAGREIVRVKFTRCGVLPGHRGLGLQRKLIRARLEWCRRRAVSSGAHITVDTYTSVDNEHSQRNLEACGFVRRASRDKTFRCYRRVV